jgi:hypothetical protein
MVFQDEQKLPLADKQCQRGEKRVGGGRESMNSATPRNPLKKRPLIVARLQAYIARSGYAGETWEKKHSESWVEGNTSMATK